VESKTPNSLRFRLQELEGPDGVFVRVIVEDKNYDLSYEQADRAYHFLMYYLKSNVRKNAAI
jgi:hypothetical protein